MYVALVPIANALQIKINTEHLLVWANYVNYIIQLASPHTVIRILPNYVATVYQLSYIIRVNIIVGLAYSSPRPVLSLIQGQRSCCITINSTCQLFSNSITVIVASCDYNNKRYIDGWMQTKITIFNFTVTNPMVQPLYVLD